MAESPTDAIQVALRRALIAFYTDGVMAGMEEAAEVADCDEGEAILAARGESQAATVEFFDAVWPAGAEVDDWPELTAVLAAIAVINPTAVPPEKGRAVPSPPNEEPRKGTEGDTHA